eukprot:TRINITY_DN127_c1_g2_i1.p2 TRINITY_DN127_c1_g2~~TRINITY_DN127_c1_g2_i1.p2  ORF type:complete len:678 (-),score=330.87 TRINITY_DN127_c1_g2_i1:132-2165(-)
MAPRVAAAVVGLVGLAAASETSVTPIAKVLTLLEEYKAKGISEKKDEEVKYSAFNRWCIDTTRIKNNEIEDGTSRMAALNAAIEKGAATIRSLTSRIQELDEDVGRWTKDKSSASAVREKEATDFRATALDYGESIDALAGAIVVLKKQAYDRSQAEGALLQVKKQARIPMKTKAALTAFLQQQQMPDEMLFREAPEAKGYEFQSGGVVDMLEQLHDEFMAKKRELEAEELKTQHGYEAIMQQLTDNIETATQEIERKTKDRAETQQVKATDEGELAQTTNDRNEDQKYLDDMTALCSQKASDFQSRQELRAQEIEALGKAIDIIGSKTVKGAGDKNLPSLLQKSKKALAQLRSSQLSPVQQSVSAFLADRAERSGSRLLHEAAQLVAANPFIKVKKMVKDLIVKLMEEGTAETEHKGWCDSELAQNQIQRDERTADVNELTATAEDLTAEIAQLSQDIADLAAAVAELDANMASQTEERTAAKAANEQTVAEAKEAQSAVQEAIAVLKEYYAKSAEATAFVQTKKQAPMDDAPETFDKPYNGLMAEGGNVVDFLEVILSDFARLESETSASEASEQQEYEKFMFESKKDKALKQNESGHKSERKTDRESALHSTQGELKMAQEMLDKAAAYYEKLKPSCVDSGVTYEDRVKAREEEIQSLQEALQILQGQDLPTLR